MIATREDYFDAAFALLAEGGKAALTTTSVCKRLGVTTGSLYHRFGSGPGFYAAFVEHWEHAVSPALRERIDRARDDERFDVLLEIARTGNHDAEKAIRAWAATDAVVAAAQRRVDDARAEHLTRVYVDAGIEPQRAATLARIGFTILIGNQQLGDRTDLAALDAALAEYGRWVRSALPGRAAISPSRAARRGGRGPARSA